MKDHTKNILITLLFAAVIGLVLFGVGYAVGTTRMGDAILDAGFRYIREQNITILGLEQNNAYDMHKVYGLVKEWLLR